MSKYIKLEDAIEAYNQAVTLLVESEMEEFNLGDFTECSFNTTQIKLIARMIESLPTIKVSEDCISRAEMLDTYAELYDVFDDYPNIIEELHKVYDKLNGLSNAISRAEGEWEVEERDSYFGKKIVLTCSECGDVFSVTESEYPNERYCPNCGAKMKG